MRNALFFGVAIVVILVAVVISITIARMWPSQSANGALSVKVANVDTARSIPVKDDADMLWIKEQPEMQSEYYEDDNTMGGVVIPDGIGTIVSNKINTEPAFFKSFLDDVVNVGYSNMDGEPPLKSSDLVDHDPYTGEETSGNGMPEDFFRHLE